MIKTPKNNLSPHPYHGKNIFYYRHPESANINKTTLPTDEITSLFCETKEIYKKDTALTTALAENDIILTTDK